MVESGLLINKLCLLFTISSYLKQIEQLSPSPPLLPQVGSPEIERDSYENSCKIRINRLMIDWLIEAQGTR